MITEFSKYRTVAKRPEPYAPEGDSGNLAVFEPFGSLNPSISSMSFSICRFEATFGSRAPARHEVFAPTLFALTGLLQFAQLDEVFVEAAVKTGFLQVEIRQRLFVLEQIRRLPGVGVPFSASAAI